MKNNFHWDWVDFVEHWL